MLQKACSGLFCLLLTLHLMRVFICIRSIPVLKQADDNKCAVEEEKTDSIKHRDGPLVHEVQNVATRENVKTNITEKGEGFTEDTSTFSIRSLPLILCIVKALVDPQVHSRSSLESGAAKTTPATTIVVTKTLAPMRAPRARFDDPLPTAATLAKTSGAPFPNERNVTPASVGDIFSVDTTDCSVGQKKESAVSPSR